MKLVPHDTLHGARSYHTACGCYYIHAEQVGRAMKRGVQGGRQWVAKDRHRRDPSGALVEVVRATTLEVLKTRLAAHIAAQEIR